MDPLSDAAELLRVTLASIGDGVITTDPRGRVTFLNPVAEALTGWTQEEAVGHSLERVFVIVNHVHRSAGTGRVFRSAARLARAPVPSSLGVLSEAGGDTSSMAMAALGGSLSPPEEVGSEPTMPNQGAGLTQDLGHRGSTRHSPWLGMVVAMPHSA